MAVDQVNVLTRGTPSTTCGPCGRRGDPQPEISKPGNCASKHWDSFTFEEETTISLICRLKLQRLRHLMQRAKLRVICL